MLSHTALGLLRQGEESRGAGREQRGAWAGPTRTLTYIRPFLPRPPGALAVRHLGSEAGDVVVALSSVPLGAFLLSTKTKLLIFVSSFGIRPGKGGPTDSAL